MDNYNDVKMGIRKLNLAIAITGTGKSGRGEDSYSYRFNDNGGFMGVFDGYGELDSSRYDNIAGKSGGYIAGNLAAESTLRMFDNGNFTFSEMDSIKLGSDLKKYIEKLKKTMGSSGERMLLPTTASIIACDYSNKDKIFLEYLWAGNSRGYLLEKSGLCQITEDDLVEQVDPILSKEKPRVINLINGETDFKINIKTVKSHNPSLIVTATDGAFSCFSTPMEFEYALLFTLNRAKSIAQWESLLKRLIGEFAEEDFTLLIAGFGFEDFKDLKHYFFDRTKEVFAEYIEPISKARENNSITEIDEMWNKYKQEYFR